jgi:hypothetical protein
LRTFVVTPLLFMMYLQIGLWGMVEASGMGGHDVDEADMKARLAAAQLYHRLIPGSWR